MSPASSPLSNRLAAENAAELMRLRSLERRVKAIVGYYDPADLAAHVAAALDGEPTYRMGEGVVRAVWVNHKLVDSFRSLYRELFPEHADKVPDA